MLKKIVLLCFVTCLLLINTNIYGYTVDDIRDLLGEERVDDTFTQSEINTIIQQYEAIEKANLELKLIEMGKEINLNNKNEEVYQKLSTELEEIRGELGLSFQNGKPLNEVLVLKSKLESILTKIAALGTFGYEMTIEYLPNIWTEKYQKVQEMLKGMSTQYDIGEVGYEMRLPLNSSFIITSPYGSRLNPITKDSVTMHYGIDLKANVGTSVYAQWNGIVSRIYETDSGGKTIEISHGLDLKTYYMHLNEFKVNVGDKITQYQLIALSGNTGNSTGPHLHFGVYLDGKYINPIYLYGSKGLSAFKTYISSNPDKNLEILEIEKILKEKPTKIIEKNIVIEPQNDFIYNPDFDKDMSNFDSNQFYDNIYKSMLDSNEIEFVED